MSTGLRRYSPRVRTSSSGESSKSPTVIVGLAAGVVCARALREYSEETATKASPSEYARTAATVPQVLGSARHDLHTREAWNGVLQSGQVGDVGRIHGVASQRRG